MNLYGGNNLGYLKEKHTSKYFTRLKKDNCDVIFAATSKKDDKGNLILREQDESIIKKIDFMDKRVLEIGFGRGEAAAYALRNGASYYKGVDFSEAAYELAITTTANLDNKPVFICDDALDFIKKIKREIFEKEEPFFDIVIMFSVLEYIPRSDLTEILSVLRDCLNPNSLLAVNTPAYKYDNDVIKNGYDKRNDEDYLDLSDTIEETQIMHCNKYSLVSLQHYMQQCGYFNITRRNFYIPDTGNSRLTRKSYRQTWDFYCSSGFPLKGEYSDDHIEYPYPFFELDKFIFNKGKMDGINIKTTQEYFDLAFKDGDYDSELFNDFLSLDVVKQKKPALVFDVGGFMGITAMLFSKFLNQNSKVIVFEPNSYNFERILENLLLNPQLGQKIEVGNLALSDKNGVSSMFISSDIDSGHSSTSRISNSFSKIINDDLPLGFFNTQVVTLTLDDFVLSSGLVPDVIKIDIEGSEHLFLFGSQNTIEKHKPVLYLEFHSEYCTLKCVQFLYKMGYEFEILKKENDGRLLVKSFYSGSANLNSTNDLLLNYLNNNIELININIQYIESRLYENISKSFDKSLLNQQEIKNELGKINDEIKNLGLHGLLRKIYRKFKYRKK